MVDLALALGFEPTIDFMDVTKVCVVFLRQSWNVPLGMNYKQLYHITLFFVMYFSTVLLRVEVQKIGHVDVKGRQ